MIIDILLPRFVCIISDLFLNILFRYSSFEFG